MPKTIFLLITTLLISSCKKTVRWTGHSKSAVIDNANVIAPNNHYNHHQLQTVLDSLQQVDPRNTIIPQLNTFVACRNWYTANIFGVYGDDDNAETGENNSPRFHTGSMKNWLLVHASNLASSITACCYDRDTFVGIHYVGDNGRVYFSAIINLSWPNPYIGSGSVTNGWLPGTGWQ